jgi:hypothetical protein
LVHIILELEDETCALVRDFDMVHGFFAVNGRSS